jgi:hypothetical protein
MKASAVQLRSRAAAQKQQFQPFFGKTALAPDRAKDASVGLGKE